MPVAVVCVEDEVSSPLSTRSQTTKPAAIAIATIAPRRTRGRENALLLFSGLPGSDSGLGSVWGLGWP